MATQPLESGPLGRIVDTAASAPRFASYRGKLFRKYLLLILSLVTIALLASGGLGIKFSYDENKAAIGSDPNHIVAGQSLDVPVENAQN